MTITLDVRTLLIIYVAIRIGMAAILVYLWSVHRNSHPARDWAAGSLMSAAGLLCLALRGHAPFLVTEVLANALLLPGWMIFDYGIIKAAGRKPSLKLGLALCALVVVSLVLYSVVDQNRPARILIHHVALAIFDLYAAFACLTHSGTSRTKTFRLIASLLILSVMTYLWRIADDVFGMSLPLPYMQSRVMIVAMSVVIFPMITILLVLQTSQRLQEEISDQARRDMLTGAFNRRAFEEFAHREWARTLRHGDPFSVLMVDIDHFKEYNDQHGHQIGDETLALVSRIAQSALRTNDIWCRIGGEEFVALLPNTSMSRAVTVAERVRASVEKTAIPTPSGSLGVTVSIGVAEHLSTHAHWAELLAASDSALYKAKAAGRNRVISA